MITSGLTGLVQFNGSGIRRWSVALALVMMILAQMAPSVLASKEWCRTDPVVLIGGRVADIFVAAPIEALVQVTETTEFLITVPTGVDTMLVAAGLGFGRGERVTFAESHALKVTAREIEVRVAVYVPATDSAMPVLVEFAPNIIGILNPVRAEGTANQ